MKCIRLLSGKIVRVPNDEATALVQANKGTYTNKAAYKRQERGQSPEDGLPKG